MLTDKRAFQRRLILRLLAARARWPDIAVVWDDSADGFRIEARPPDVARPPTGHVWMMAIEAKTFVLYDVPAAARTLGMR